MTYVCLLITLFNILINKKAGHFGKRKTYSSARERTRKLHTSEYTISYAKKRKIFFIPMKVQLITVSSAILDISEINNISSSLKKKKKIYIYISREGEREKEREKKESANEKGKEKEKEKKGGKERKRECEREGKGEGKREERRERERREGRRGENRESGTKSSSLSTPPSPNAFLSPVPSSDETRE